MKFNWITLHVADMERSRAFYGDYLGMKIAREFTQPGGRRFTFFESENGMQVELIAQDGAPKLTAVGWQRPGKRASSPGSRWCWADTWRCFTPWIPTACVSRSPEGEAPWRPSMSGSGIIGRSIPQAALREGRRW